MLTYNELRELVTLKLIRLPPYVLKNYNTLDTAQFFLEHLSKLFSGEMF